MHLTKLGSTELKHREGFYYYGTAEKHLETLKPAQAGAMVTAAGSITGWEAADGPSS